MKFGIIDHFEWLKCKSGYKDLASSGVHGLETLAELGVETADLPLSGGNPYGYPPLKEWLAHKFGVTTDRVALAQGASGANFAAMASLIGPNDRVVLETPVYQPMVAVVQAVNDEAPIFFERLPAENFRIDPERPFEVCAKPRLVVMTNLHNPSGVFEPAETFIQIADRAADNDGYLLVDEIFLPFLDGKEWQCVAAHHDRIIATGSLTKAWGLSGLRMGWAVGPSDVIYKIQRLLDYTQGVQSVFNEALALRLLESGVAQKLLQNSRDLVNNNRELVLQRLKNWGRITFTPPAAGAVIYGRHPKGASTDAFCQALFEKHNILITPGRFFRDPAGIRLGVTGRQEEIINWFEKLIEVYEIHWHE